MAIRLAVICAGCCTSKLTKQQWWRIAVSRPNCHLLNECINLHQSSWLSVPLRGIVVARYIDTVSRKERKHLWQICNRTTGLQLLLWGSAELVKEPCTVCCPPTGHERADTTWPEQPPTLVKLEALPRHLYLIWIAGQSWCCELNIKLNQICWLWVRGFGNSLRNSQQPSWKSETHLVTPSCLLGWFKLQYNNHLKDGNFGG